ncbi:hypothetical protein BDW42DRAFT_197301 [Aspergillus taichungensis]|uniref:Uncharacterized protein n=1 Tax=Aspergillus taichungensis TaxID=482145 RepID=A0A2J5HGW3_9EURO|nr:hypothetical protein BDW42DRAFT_197301 [Aspergillus taichungensis]
MFFKTILTILTFTLTFNLMALGTAIALPRNINTVLDKLTELGTLEGKAWGDGMQATTAATEKINGAFHEADSKQIKDITVGMGNAMPKTFDLFTKRSNDFEKAYLRGVICFHLKSLLARTESLADALGERMTEKDRKVMDEVVEDVVDGYEDVIDEFE